MDASLKVPLYGLETMARGLLVNLPTSLLSLDEVDSVCTLLVAYLLLQVVGLCWAFLVNAAIAMTKFGPPKDDNSLRVIASFYVAYASVRVVFGFAQSVLNISLESTKAFPDAAQQLARGGIGTLRLLPLVFVPVLILEVALLSADFCGVGTAICEYTGVSFLQLHGRYPELRRLVLFSILLVVVQLWQAALQQFPNWQEAFRSGGMSKSSRRLFQVSVLLLAAYSFYLVLFAQVWDDATSCAVLTGWTLWLFFFLPVLVRVHGDKWVRDTALAGESLAAAGSPPLAPSMSRESSSSSLASSSSTNKGSGTFDFWITSKQTPLDEQAPSSPSPSPSSPSQQQQQQQSGTTNNSGNDLRVLAAFLRLSQVFLFSIVFVVVCFFRGYPEAQLLLTFLTIVVPSLYCCTYLFCVLVIRTGVTAVLVGTPVAILFAVGITRLAQSTGNGAVLLVFAHAMSRGAKFFSEDEVAGSGDDDENVGVGEEGGGSGGGGVGGGGGSASTHGGLTTSTSTTGGDGGGDPLSADQNPLVSKPKSSSNALYLLEERGSKHSSLVSIIPKRVKKHWLVVASKQNFRFVFNLTRRLAMSDSILSGIIRLFSSLAIIFALILASLSMASYAQQSLQIFPKLIDFEYDAPHGRVLFNHRISNVTLHLAPPMPTPPLVINDDNDAATSCPATQQQQQQQQQQQLALPHYALCPWRWRDSLSLLDFAILSELAYFDDDGMQHMVDVLFPTLDLVVVPRPLSAAAYAGASPAYLELSSRRLNSTIIAVRGTDVGRLRDFMEDVNLYAEAVVFSMLSAVFPTIRLWTHDTTSRVIEWLYESNSFFGLASEAEYYQPLTDRVKELQQQQKTGSVVLTGHSLGGGLARIVGTLTYAPSVSFSPPGLRLSYRKYSEGPAQKRKHDGSSLLHESVSVVSEFDWITNIDVQVGLVQQILCDHSDKAHLLACHLLEPTICNILSHCGDTRFTHCETTFDLKSLRHVFSHWGWLGLTTTVLLISFTLGLAILPEIM